MKVRSYIAAFCIPDNDHLNSNTRSLYAGEKSFSIKSPQKRYASLLKYESSACIFAALRSQWLAVNAFGQAVDICAAHAAALKMHLP
jgi:hypothetical protein